MTAIEKSRMFVCLLVTWLVWAAAGLSASAQDPASDDPATVTLRVIDGKSDQPIAGAEVAMGIG